jgi:hypothetical protein
VEESVELARILLTDPVGSTAGGHLGWGEALAARGDADGAEDHARRARVLWQEHGYGTCERRAAELAAQSAAEA